MDWDELTHVAKMAYNIFPHSSAGEPPFYLMFGCDTFMPTWFKLLLPKLRCMVDEGFKIQLDAMREIYKMAVLNLKTARDKCHPPIQDPDNAELKIEDMILLKNHAPTDAFDAKYKHKFRICKQISDKAFDVQDSAGNSHGYLCNTSNYYILLNMY